MQANIGRYAIGRHINLILGDTAGGTFTATFGSNESLLIDRDVLSCGPTPRRQGLDEWRDLRFKYWAGLVPGAIENYEASPKDILVNAAAIRDAERITIWAATGLTEQLFIASACNLLATVNGALDRVELVQFEYLTGRRARVIGVGELNEAQMRSHPFALPLTGEVFASYVAAWEALTSPDPQAIEHFATRNVSANDWLKEAMRLMLRRFPDATTGLTHWDLRLLAHVRSHGRKAARVIGETMGENWHDADLVGDYFLFGRLLKMGAKRLPQPLLRITGDTSDMRATEVELTQFGIDLLEGRASNFPTNPIEDWAAGVELSSSRGCLWFTNGDRLVAHRPPEREH